MKGFECGTVNSLCCVVEVSGNAVDNGDKSKTLYFTLWSF
jgi:hypothetical protein